LKFWRPLPPLSQLPDGLLLPALVPFSCNTATSFPPFLTPAAGLLSSFSPRGMGKVPFGPLSQTETFSPIVGGDIYLTRLVRVQVFFFLSRFPPPPYTPFFQHGVPPPLKGSCPSPFYPVWTSSLEISREEKVKTPLLPLVFRDSLSKEIRLIPSDSRPLLLSTVHLQALLQASPRKEGEVLFLAPG